MQGRQNVGQRQFAAEARREVAGVAHGEGASLGEIDGQEDLGKRNHVRLNIRIRRSRTPVGRGIDETAMDFRRILPETRWQSRPSPGSPVSCLFTAGAAWLAPPPDPAWLSRSGEQR